jgi:hypothetical protein
VPVASTRPALSSEAQAELDQRLIRAAKANDVGAVADPAIRDPQGRTALENAERLGFWQIAALIRSRR